MKKQLLAIGLSLCAMSAASAATETRFVSTEQLAKACGKSASADSQSFCNGYAQGVYDMYVASRHPTKNPPFLCFPKPGPTRASVIEGYVAWAGRNPQYAKTSAADSLMRYVGGVFPCKK